MWMIKGFRVGNLEAKRYQQENLPDWLADYGEAAHQVCFPSTLPRSNFEESCAVPDKELNIIGSASHVHDDHAAEPQPLTIETLPALPNVVTYELNSQERDSAISRYKEKKKTRRMDCRVLEYTAISDLVSYVRAYHIIYLFYLLKAYIKLFPYFLGWA
ncbi:hypothetical protein D5086_019122 [Populus alba]|uniref:Uncharacterized protein n=1 Tax=Populus alba TaxID=43335 RepID=A0ACC4BGB4_POPAL